MGCVVCRSYSRRNWNGRRKLSEECYNIGIVEDMEMEIDTDINSNIKKQRERPSQEVAS